MNKMDKIEWFEWVDSSGCAAGWQIWEKIDAEEPSIQTVGFVVRETETAVTICPTGYRDRNGDLHSMGMVIIPKCAIVQRCEMVTKETK